MVGDADAELDDRASREPTARSAARRSIGVRCGTGTVNGSVFSVFIRGEASGGETGDAEVVWASDCEAAVDDTTGVSEGVGVMDLSRSTFTAVLVTCEGATASGGTGWGALGGRPVVAGWRGTLAGGRPVDFRATGMYSSSLRPAGSEGEWP